MKNLVKNAKLQLIITKLCNREMIAYLIVGGLTTLVNIVAYHIFCNKLGVANLVANIIAWILAVIFAYFANDRIVFISEKKGMQEEIIKAGKFFAARIFSLGVDEAGMFLLVDLIFMNNLVAKIIMNVIVVIINYVFSKLFIFNK